MMVTDVGSCMTHISYVHWWQRVLHAGNPVSAAACDKAIPGLSWS